MQADGFELFGDFVQASQVRRVQRKHIAHLADDQRSPRSADHVHHQKVNRHAGAAQRRRNDVMNRGIHQPVIHIEQAVGNGEQRKGQRDRSNALVNSKIRERNGQQRGNSGDLHASAAVALYDSVTPDSGARSAQNAANGINNSCGYSRARDAHVMNAAEECRKKCSDGIQVEVHQRAGDGDPPERGNAQHCPDGAGIDRRAHAFQKRHARAHAT